MGFGFSVPGLYGPLKTASTLEAGPRSLPAMSLVQVPAPPPKFGFWKGMGQADETTGATGWDKLGMVGAGLQDLGYGGSDNQDAMTKSIDARQTRQTAREDKLTEREQRKLLAKLRFPDDPVRQVAYALNSKPYDEADAESFKPRTVGNHVVVDGKSVYEAPELVHDGPIYGTQTSGGYTQTGQRGRTYGEDLDATKFDYTKTQDIIKNNLDRMRVGIAQGHLNVAQSGDRRGWQTERRVAGGGNPYGGGNGFDGVSTAELLAALRGGR